MKSGIVTWSEGNTISVLENVDFPDLLRCNIMTAKQAYLTGSDIWDLA